MFWDLIQRNKLNGAAPAILTLEDETDWFQLAELADEVCGLLRGLKFRRCGLLFGADPVSLAVAAALDHLRKETFLIDPDTSSERVRQIENDFHLHARFCVQKSGELEFDVLAHPGERSGEVESCVTILTSGTAGKPKAARHTWKSLMRPVRKTNSGAKRWFLSYRPHLYAGIQVLLQAFVNGGPIVVSDSNDAGEQFHVLLQRQVQCISGSPSFWRKLFLVIHANSIGKIPLEQITLGGEIVDQQILDLLANTFPNARITHIYATTELGRCFSVTDGRAGFPASYLDASMDGVQMKIDQGQLWIRSENAMSSYDQFVERENRLLRSEDGWTCTGDLVEVLDDRVHFVGRKTDLINVGGNKVNPNLVEKTIREIKEVQDVRVYGKDSTIAGQLVACEIVTSDSADAIKKRIFQHCANVLDRFHQPRLIEIVDQIELSSAGKKKR